MNQSTLSFTVPNLDEYAIIAVLLTTQPEKHISYDCDSIQQLMSPFGSGTWGFTMIPTEYMKSQTTTKKYTRFAAVSSDASDAFTVLLKFNQNIIDAEIMSYKGTWGPSLWSFMIFGVN